MIRIWDQLLLLRPGAADLIQILIVAVLIYRALLLIQRTRAMQMLLGLFLLVFAYAGAVVLDFQLIRYLMETFFRYGVIAALVVFQPELRSGLARLGRSRLLRVFNNLEENRVVDEIVEAVVSLTRTKVGGIIAIEQDVGLDEYGATGSPVDARVSSQMLTTIFTPYSPLHDGAVIISGDQIRSAGAILPLTQYPVHDKSLGTRHRAALGLSEETDAVVIVVSEETAKVSVARAGRFERDLTPERLRDILSGTRTDASGTMAAVTGSVPLPKP